MSILSTTFITLGNGVSMSAPRTISAHEFFSDCKTQKHSKKIEKIREAKAAHEETLTNLEAVRHLPKGDPNLVSAEKAEKTAGNKVSGLKKTLPAVSLSGVYSGRREKENLQQHSGLLQIDVDKLTRSEAEALRGRLAGDPHIVWAALSPSGTGVKGAMRIPPDKSLHERAWHAVQNYLRKTYGAEIDSSTKDVVRLCFATHDPQAFIASDERTVLDIEKWAPAPDPKPETKPEPPSPSLPPTQGTTSPANNYARAVLQSSCTQIRNAPDGERHDARLKHTCLVGGYVAGGYLSEEEALEGLVQSATSNTSNASKAERDVRDALKKGQESPLHPPTDRPSTDQTPRTDSPATPSPDSDPPADKVLEPEPDFDADADADTDADTDDPELTGFAAARAETERTQLNGKFYRGLAKYKGSTWFCDVRTEGKGENQKEVPVSVFVGAFTFKRAFTQVDKTLEHNAEHKHFLEINRGRRGRITVEVGAAEIITGTELRKVLKRKADVTLEALTLPVINAINRKLEREQAPVIRLVDRIGLDKESGAYLFGRFLYLNGQRIEANAEGFFPEQGLRCRTQEPFVTDLESSANPAEMLQTIMKIYGTKALSVVAYYVLTLIKHDILKEKDGAFPFMSLRGTRGSGKTQLVDWLNQAFFQHWHGVDAKHSSTAVSYSRRFYHRRGLVIPFNEANGAFPRSFDENGLLTAYHGNSLYDRGKYDNTNDVISLPFEAGLLFVQNVEPFKVPAVKERIVSVQFFNAEEGGVTDESTEAMRRLQAYSPAQRASLGHHVLTNIEAIKTAILSGLPQAKADIAEAGVQSPRVCFTHGLVLAAARALGEHFGVPVPSSFDAGLVSFAQATERQAGAGNDLADAFFDAFAALSSAPQYAGMNPVQLEAGQDYLQDSEQLYIRMTGVLQKMGQVQYHFAKDREILTALKQHPRFVAASYKYRGNELNGRWASGNSEWCWIFKRETDL